MSAAMKTRSMEEAHVRAKNARSASAGEVAPIEITGILRGVVRKPKEEAYTYTGHAFGGLSWFVTISSANASDRGQRVGHTTTTEGIKKSFKNELFRYFGLGLFRLFL